MGTKQQAIRALQAHTPGAVLNDLSGTETYDVTLEAPVGQHWEGDVHCRCVGAWYDTGIKPEYWDLVLEAMADLPKAVSCQRTRCELFSEGVCEYWLGYCG